jgi:hypothetical protein
MDIEELTKRQYKYKTHNFSYEFRTGKAEPNPKYFEWKTYRVFA